MASLASWLGWACTAVGAAAGEGATARVVAPRVESLTYVSAVLGRSRRLSAVLPEGYARRRRDWPVLYLLHGRGRHDRSLIDNPAACEALRQSRAVVILPSGDDGWYIDSPVRPEDRDGAALAEALAVAEDYYGLSRDPARRGLSGWSMGGYGCVTAALARPGQFGLVAPIIGLLDFPRRGLPEGYSYVVPERRFGSDPATWASLNPLTRAEGLRGSQVLLITAERAFDRVMNENFHARLTELGIPHRFEVLPGGHTFETVRLALPRVVAFANDVLVPP